MARLYLGAGLVAALLGLLWNTKRLEDRVAQLRFEQAACLARQTDLLEDIRSDATVTDPRNFDVPERWLVQPRGGR